MAQNPKPLRRERKAKKHQDRISKRIINEVISEDRDGRPFRKHKAWRKWYARRCAQFRKWGLTPP